MLRNDPNACTGCDNNPVESPPEVVSGLDLEGWAPIISAGFELHDLAELGLFEMPSLIHLFLVRIIHRYEIDSRLRRGAKYARGVGPFSVSQ